MRSPAPPPPLLSNWARTVSARPAAFAEPESAAEVSALLRAVAARHGRVRVLGGGHSPNAGAFSADTMLSLRRMRRVLAVERGAARGRPARVRVEAGALLSELNEALAAHALALPNLGSVSEVTVGGVIATGTHGTSGVAAASASASSSAAAGGVAAAAAGYALGPLSSFVAELTVVLADGSVVVTSRERDDARLPFRAALCHLGCLGVVTEAVLECAEAFDLRASCATQSFAALLEDCGAIGSSGEPGGASEAATALGAALARAADAPFAKLLWYPHTDLAVLWRAEPLPPLALRPPPPPPLLSLAGLALRTRAAWRWCVASGFGYYALEAALFVSLAAPTLLAPAITRLWAGVLFSTPAVLDADRSDRVLNIECLFRQRVSEWAVPLPRLPEALARLRGAIAGGSDGGGDGGSSGCFVAHFPVEVRFVAADDAWLSPSFGPPGATFAFVGIVAYRPWGVDSDFRGLFAEFEAIMAALGGRPHWAKDFALAGDAGFAARLPRWRDFKALRARLDPGRLFVNDYVRRTLGLEDADADVDAEGADVSERAASGRHG